MNFLITGDKCLDDKESAVHQWPTPDPGYICTEISDSPHGNKFSVPMVKLKVPTTLYDPHSEFVAIALAD